MQTINPNLKLFEIVH